MHQSVSRAALAAGAALACGAALAGCSSGSDDAASASPSMVGGMTECTQEILQKATDLYAGSLGNSVASFEGVDCADGWAVTSAVIGDAPQTIIFQAEGQFWIPQDKAKVCGTYDAASPDAVPEDATIPAALYPIGCLAG